MATSYSQKFPYMVSGEDPCPSTCFARPSDCGVCLSFTNHVLDFRLETQVFLGFSEIYIQLGCAWLQLASAPFPHFILARNRAWAAEAVNRTSRYRLLLALSLLS